MNKVIFLSMLFLAIDVFGLQRAAAQLGPPAPPQVLSQGAISLATKPPRTKVVRIYQGTGNFDDAMAEKLRPLLAKAFPFSLPEAPKAVPGATVVAPAKPEGQSKLTSTAHL